MLRTMGLAGGLAALLLWGQTTGDLVVVSETGEPFRLYLNGEWIAETPVTRAEAHEVPQGPQRATLHIYPSEGRVVQLKKTFYVEAGWVEYYAIRRDRKGYKVTQFNRVPREESQPPASPDLPPTPSPSPGGPPPAAGTPPPTAPAPGTQTNQQTIVFNPTIQIQTGGGGTQVSGQPAPQPGAPSGPLPPQVPSTGYSGPCNCPWPSSRETIARIHSTLQSEPFEETRVEILKSFLRHNCVWTRDLKELLGLFTFDDNRLELAKFAYDYTHDLSSYAEVAEALTFTHHRQELVRYISSRSPRQTCGGGVGIYPPAGGQPQAPPGLGQPASSQGRPCQPCMENGAFQQALQTVRNTASEPTRLQVAKQIASTNCLASAQVRELCKALVSEPSRVDLAKYAYTRACDPQNYFLVNDAFVSVSSKEELARYIQGLAGR